MFRSFTKGRFDHREEMTLAVIAVLIPLVSLQSLII